MTTLTFMGLALAVSVFGAIPIVTREFMVKSKRKTVLMSSSTALSLILAATLFFSITTMPKALVVYQYEDGEVIYKTVRGEHVDVNDISLDEYVSLPIAKIVSE